MQSPTLDGSSSPTGRPLQMSADGVKGQALAGFRRRPLGSLTLDQHVPSPPAHAQKPMGPPSSELVLHAQSCPRSHQEN